MIMKHLIFSLLLLGISLRAKQTKPNIILLMGDDHGWEEVGYNGHPYVKTPNLDKMAAAGLRLDNFYAQPSCSPTRGSVLTGRHPNRYGIFRPGYSIRPKEITIAHLLKDAGYATAHFGKWHVGPVKQSSPTSPGVMGFEHWLSHDNFFEMDPVFSLNGGPPKKIYGESSEILIDGDKNTGVELFNLRNDSAESNNLAGSQSVMVEKLKKEMRDWQASALNSLMEADYKSK